MLITIKGINKKAEGRVGVLLEDGSWMTAWNTIKKDGKRIDNPALPYLEKGAEVDVVTIENGDYINIIGVNEDTTPKKAETPKEGGNPAQKQAPQQTDWNVRNIEVDRGMLISYVLEHLVSSGKVKAEADGFVSMETVGKWVNFLFDIQRIKPMKLPEVAGLLPPETGDLKPEKKEEEKVSEEMNMLAGVLEKIKGAKNIKELDIMKKSVVEHGKDLTDDQLTAISDAYDERKLKIVQEAMNKK